ncbi:MAG TPA: DUF2017 domain-containing protein [Streptosporangiaceae bacterium]
MSAAEPADDSGAEEQMAGFRRSSGGVSARFAGAQAGIIRSLVGQVAELVGDDLDSQPAGETGQDATGPGASEADEAIAAFAADLGFSGSTQVPDDPVLARLLPDAYQDDPQAAGEFRRYTEQNLRAGKLAAAQTVLATLPESGGRVRLSREQAELWLRALNDVRLALGVVLEVTDDFDEQSSDISPEDPRSAYIWVYHWLAYLQDSLLEAIS